jgi:hypothetical protein
MLIAPARLTLWKRRPYFRCPVANNAWLAAAGYRRILCDRFYCVKVYGAATGQESKTFIPVIFKLLSGLTRLTRMLRTRSKLVSIRSIFSHIFITFVFGNFYFGKLITLPPQSCKSSCWQPVATIIFVTTSLTWQTAQALKMLEVTVSSPGRGTSHTDSWYLLSVSAQWRHFSRSPFRLIACNYHLNHVTWNRHSGIKLLAYHSQQNTVH